MAVLMAAQFIITGILVYFLYLIRAQESKEKVIQEDLNEISEVIQINARNAMHNGIVYYTGRLSDALRFSLSELNQKPLKTISEKTAENYKKKPAQVIGFGMDKEKTNKEKKPAVSSSYLSQNHKPGSGLNSEFDYIKKHKKIAVAIKKTIPPTAETISNNEIKYILEIAKGATYKSRSTVQKVFLAMRTIGIENVKPENL